MDFQDSPTTPETIRRHVEQVLSSPGLVKSRSLNRLLTYLVDDALNPSSPPLKEHTLGVDVFDRGEGFDPREDNIVRVQVRNLRTKLAEYYAGDGKDDPVRIELPKGAYVVSFTTVNTPSEPPPLDRRPPRWKLAAAVGALALAIGAGWVLLRPNPGASHSPHVVAVLPFTNLDPKAETEFFSDGLAEELINDLAQLDGITVIARSSSFRFRGGSPELKQIADQLKATEVVEGSVRQQDTSVRVMIRLVAVPSGRTVWSGQFDRPISNLIRTEEEIASGVTAGLKLTLSRPRIEKPINPDAYNAYLRGRYYWEKVDPNAGPKSIEMFERAIQLDSTYAAPYVGLAASYGLENVFGLSPPLKTWPKIDAMLIRALQLDETSSEAHTLMGGVYAWYQWDYAKAEREYRRGMELGPGSLIAHQYFASMLGALGRFQEADVEMRKSVQLDPLNQFLHWAEGQLRYWEGDLKAARRALINLHREDPNLLYVYPLLVPVESALGEHAEAVKLAEEFVRLSTNKATAIGVAGEAYARAGDRTKADDALKRLDGISQSQFIPATGRAYIYLALGDREQALHWLTVACEERSLRPPWLLVDARFRPLRGDPEFKKLLSQTNLKIQ